MVKQRAGFSHIHQEIDVGSRPGSRARGPPSRQGAIPIHGILIALVFLFATQAPLTSQDLYLGTPAVGNFSNGAPSNHSPITRCQQMYLGTYFGATPVNLYPMTFYSKGDGPSSYAPGAYDMYLSYATVPIGGLTDDFDANITSAQTWVASASLSGAVAANSPLTFMVNSPFPRDPALGNLLLDVQIDRGSSPAFLQNQGFQSLSNVSCVNRAWIHDGESYIGGTTGSGLITTFGTSGSNNVVPEPATVILLATGPFGLGFAARLRRDGASWKVDPEGE